MSPEGIGLPKVMKEGHCRPCTLILRFRQVLHPLDLPGTPTIIAPLEPDLLHNEQCRQKQSRLSVVTLTCRILQCHCLEMVCASS